MKYEIICALFLLKAKVNERLFTQHALPDYQSGSFSWFPQYLEWSASQAG